MSAPRQLHDLGQSSQDDSSANALIRRYRRLRLARP
jgi:hypothetical protein